MVAMFALKLQQLKLTMAVQLITKHLQVHSLKLVTLRKYYARQALSKMILARLAVMIALKESTAILQDYLMVKTALMVTIVMIWRLFTLTYANMENTQIPTIMDTVRPVPKTNTVKLMHSSEIALV